MNRLMTVLLILTGVFCACRDSGALPFTYKLPYEAGVTKTYRVTAVICLKDEPSWIVAHALNGAVRTVDDTNQGVFTEEWDLTDDNYKTLEAGRFYVKGIYMPAEKWKIDGQWHSLVAQYVSSPGDSWTPPKERDQEFPPIHGHLMEPIYTVSVGENGQAAFWSGYIENAVNPFLVDMNKPVGIDQVVRRFPSGGWAGGTAVASEGGHIWNCRGRAIASPTMRSFGASRDSRGRMVTVLGEGASGVVNDLTVAQCDGAFHLYSADANLKKLFVINGQNGQIVKELADLPVLATQPDRVTPGSKLYALRDSAEGGREVIGFPLENGIPAADPAVEFKLPESAKDASDLAMDRKGNFFLLCGRQVVKLSPTGEVLLTIGKSGVQQGSYNPEILVGPTSVTCWTDKDGADRVLVCESYGMQRISEWNAETGKPMREWFLCQDAHAGYGLDSLRPEFVYTRSLLGDAIHRYLVDYKTGAWKLESVWEGVCSAGKYQVPMTLFPRIVNLPQGKYMVFGGGGYRVSGSYSIFRFQDNRWMPSAAVVNGNWWHDANGDGQVQDEEFDGSATKGHSGTYWGDKILDDLSICHFIRRTPFIQRLAPSGFDAHGNPIYSGADWKPLIVDSVLAANLGQCPKPDAAHGGNETGNGFWDWSDIAGDPRSALYVAGDNWPSLKEGGVDTAGKICKEWKLTCWVPDGNGGYKMKWRVGRKALGVAEPGQVYGTLHISDPVYGMVGVEDANGIYHVFTTDGMYVDTLMHHSFRYGLPQGGMYSHSGESWFGANCLNRDDGQVYVFMGRSSNNIYSVPNWKPDFVQPLAIKAKDGSFEQRK